MTNSQSIGNHSNNNTQNLYITNIEQRTLIPTVIFQLLKYVEGFHSQNDEKFLLEQPAELKAKLQFNNSRRYIRLFKEGLGNYILLEKVLNEVEYQKKMDIFNSYFKNVAGRINKEQPVLLYNPKTDEFPVSIDQLSEGTSTGTRKSLIAAYDIAYQLFARKINKVTPKFIVHDVLESIEGDDIRALVNEVESNQIQYISAILKEKLVSSGISLEEQNKMIILELYKSPLKY